MEVGTSHASIPYTQSGTFHDTRGGYEVTSPQTFKPKWLNGTHPQNIPNWTDLPNLKGDGLVAKISAFPQSIGVDSNGATTPIRPNSNDLDAGINNFNDAVQHPLIVGYRRAQQAVITRLNGLSVPFIVGYLNPGQNPQTSLDNAVFHFTGDSNQAQTPSSPLSLPDPALARMMLIAAQGPVELMYTNSQGQRIGYDPVNHTDINEIPNAAYARASDTDRKTIAIAAPTAGAGALTVTSVGSGNGKWVGVFGDSLTTAGLFYMTSTVTSGQVITLSVTIPQSTIEIPVPPKVEAGQDVIATPSQPVLFAGQFTDVNPNDTHQVSWNFGDTTYSSGLLTTTHIYTMPGIYTATLTVTDAFGFVISDSLQVAVKGILDAFNRPNSTALGPDWTERSGDWHIFANTLRNVSTVNTGWDIVASHNSGPYSNVAVSAQVYTVVGGSGTTSLGVRWSAYDNGVPINGYTAELLPDGQVLLWRVSDWALLGNYTIPNYPAGQPITLTLRADGAILSVAVNGTRYITSLKILISRPYTLVTCDKPLLPL
jgi:PKD repeat protein